MSRIYKISLSRPRASTSIHRSVSLPHVSTSLRIINLCRPHVFTRVCLFIGQSLPRVSTCILISLYRPHVSTSFHIKMSRPLVSPSIHITLPRPRVSTPIHTNLTPIRVSTSIQKIWLVRKHLRQFISLTLNPRITKSILRRQLGRVYLSPSSTSVSSARISVYSYTSQSRPRVSMSTYITQSRLRVSTSIHLSLSGPSVLLSIHIN